jgi:uncharacterized membrane protein YkvA (DUF1232 family)
MQMTKEQEEQARKQFEDSIDDVDNDDVEYASKKGMSQLKKFGNKPPEVLIKLWDDIKLMVSLVTDYAQGNYTEVPWRSIAAFAGAIIYFVSPIDVIPDFIPVIGFLDDALVIQLALDFAGKDLETYKKWKKSQ